jgi:carotenoid 1,2-hydratase
VIGFIGSVFSPWYRWSGRRCPQDHVCLNVATYGPSARFTMTDRGRAALRQSRDELRIGPSRMAWEGGRLVVEVDEWGAPPRIGRLRGRITVTPVAVTGIEVALTPDGGHLWRPFAPAARIEVDLEPGHRWTGHGYFDANFGNAALEADFRTWTWGRYPLPDDGAATFYDAVRHDGSPLAVALRFDAAGRAERVDPPPAARLPRTFWQLARSTRADPGFAPRQEMALLDAPFYSRSMVRTRIDGAETVGVHEALDLRRYRQPWLKPMIAMRVPRRRGWSFGD